MQQIEVFNPRKAQAWSQKPTYNEIPNFDKVTKAEFAMYQKKAANFNFEQEDGVSELENLKEEITKIQGFWKANKTVLPQMYELSLRYAYVFSNSAEVERFFSYYKKILSQERHSLSIETLKHLSFLYFNLAKFE